MEYSTHLIVAIDAATVNIGAFEVSLLGPLKERTAGPVSGRGRFFAQDAFEPSQHVFIVYPTLKAHNIEFSCRPESFRYAPVLRTAFFLNRPHLGGQLQRFVRCIPQLLLLLGLHIVLDHLPECFVLLPFLQVGHLIILRFFHQFQVALEPLGGQFAFRYAQEDRATFLSGVGTISKTTTVGNRGDVLITLIYSDVQSLSCPTLAFRVCRRRVHRCPG